MSIDTWHATITADIGQLRAAAHAACVVPDDDTEHPLFAPSDQNDRPAQAMRDEATRGNDRDGDYTTIPTTHVFTGERPDPTFRAADARHGHATSVCTQIASLVEDWYRAVAISLHQFGRDVIGPHGGRWEPPDVMWRTTASGAKFADVPPADVHRFIDDHCRWLHLEDERGTWGAADALVDSPADPEQHGERLRALQARTRQVRDRLTARTPTIPPARRPCLNPHGRTNHPAGPKAVAGVCTGCRQPACAADHRPCRLRLSPEDARRGRRNCGPCRVYAHRNSKADA